MTSNWVSFIKYRNNVCLTIDNMLAERAIRPLTTQRNSMLHFGGDEGAEMAATYHNLSANKTINGALRFMFIMGWMTYGTHFSRSKSKI